MTHMHNKSFGCEILPTFRYRPAKNTTQVRVPRLQPGLTAHPLTATFQQRASGRISAAAGLRMKGTMRMS